VKKHLRKSDIVRLVQFATWADGENMTLVDAEASVDDFLKRQGAEIEDTEDMELGDLGLL
jgi:hypothetical protein